MWPAAPNLAVVLGRVSPADRDTLLAVAQDNNAPDRILDMLRQLPPGELFDNVNGVWTSLGHGVENHRR